MLTSSVHNYLDPDEYAASVRGTTLELTVTERGQFSGNVIRIDLHDLWMQHLSENLASIGHSALVPGRIVVSFWVESTPEPVWNGLAIQPSQIIWHKEAEQFYRRASGPSQRVGMSLPLDVISTAAASIAGRDLAELRHGQVVTPYPAALARLRRLHHAARVVAQTAPEVIANKEAARGLEQTLITAMVQCLRIAPVQDKSTTYRRHDLIMRRFHQEISVHPETAVYIPELCSAVNVPERTLRLCCQESLGMSPKRYLLLRRMNLARQALRRADPIGTTVTSVVAEFGFWNFGRFAVEYRQLFGEMPSTTLRSCAA